MKISTSKFYILVLSWKRLNCQHRVKDELQNQMEEFMYVRVSLWRGRLFTTQSTVCSNPQPDPTDNLPKQISIQKQLKVELLLLRVNTNQLRCFRHLVRLPPGHLPGGGVLGMSSEVPSRQSWDMLERLCLGWPGNAVEFPKRSWWKWQGRGGPPCWSCNPSDWDQNK